MVRRTRGRGRSNSRVMSVDLSDVETYTPMEEGTHNLKVDSIEVKEGDAGTYWAWKFVAADKDGPEGSVNHNTSFAKQALFNLKSLLSSLEVDIPDSEFDLDADEMIGLEMEGEVVHEVVDTDNGKRTYGRIVDHSPVEKKSSSKRSSKKDEEEDEKPTRKKAGKKKAITEEDIAEMSQDELEEVITEHELDIDLGDFKTVSKMRAGVIAALIDIGVIEAEEEPEEEEEKPARSSRSSRRSAAKEEEEPEDDRPSRRTTRRARR